MFFEIDVHVSCVVLTPNSICTERESTLQTYLTSFNYKHLKGEKCFYKFEVTSLCLHVQGVINTCLMCLKITRVGTLTCLKLMFQ